MVCTGGAGGQGLCSHTGGGDKVCSEYWPFFVVFLNPLAGHQGRGLFAQLEMGKLRHKAFQHLLKWHNGRIETAVGQSSFPGVRLCPREN